MKGHCLSLQVLWFCPLPPNFFLLRQVMHCPQSSGIAQASHSPHRDLFVFSTAKHSQHFHSPGGILYSLGMWHFIWKDFSQKSQHIRSSNIGMENVIFEGTNAHYEIFPFLLGMNKNLSEIIFPLTSSCAADKALIIIGFVLFGLKCNR